MRDILRQLVLERELEVLTGKVAVDYMQMFIEYRPAHSIIKKMQWLMGASSRGVLQKFVHLGRQYWAVIFWHAVIWR